MWKTKLELDKEDIDLIHKGIKHLSHLCDGAGSIDGMGFNRDDTDFGHSLASYSVLSEKQAIAGLKMIIKYRRQLPEDMVEEFDRILSGKSKSTTISKELDKGINEAQNKFIEEKYKDKWENNEEHKSYESKSSKLIEELKKIDKEEFRKEIEGDFKQEDLKKVIENLPINVPINVPTIFNSDNQVELTNGKIITLNYQQVDALRDIKKWLLDRYDLFYTLSGYAGTGKTTIVKEALKEARYMKIAVSAPTHKAKKVIAKTTGRDSHTIQSLLGLQPNTDLDNFNINKPQFDQSKDPKIGEYNLVVIDEASMLNKDLFTYLTNEAKFFKTKILFMGDAAQLPPVKESISKVFTSDIIKSKSELTKVERQADGNPLMLIYDAIRSNISSPIDMFEHTTKITEEGEGVEFHGNVETFKAKVIDTFKSEDFTANRDHAKLLSWTNVQVRTWNKIIRNALFGKEVRILENNDLLLSYTTLLGPNGKPLIENSAEYEVKGVREDTKTFNLDTTNTEEQLIDIDGYQIELTSDGIFIGQEIFVVKPDLNNYARFLSIFHERVNYARRFKGRAWREYYQFKEACLLMEDLRDSKGGLIVKKDLDYGYAITVHKSQGSTYNIAFITENVIDDNPLSEERNKLKYVAFSRPSKIAISLSNKTVKI